MTAELRRLRRIASDARGTYVGRHWPSMAAMRRDGIGYGLVEDGMHEQLIRRYLDTFQPEFMVDLLSRYAALLAVADAARALTYGYALTSDELPPDDGWGPLFLALRAALTPEEPTDG